jgi:hypothetical protein
MSPTAYHYKNDTREQLRNSYVRSEASAQQRRPGVSVAQRSTRNPFTPLSDCIPHWHFLFASRITLAELPFPYTLSIYSRTVLHTRDETCDRMRDRPTLCEWFRGCPNEALIYYSFSDKWLCGYCIGYARIGVPFCAHDGWRRGTCVNVESQDWFCDLHGHHCDAVIERPPGLLTGNAHRCMQRASGECSQYN